MNATDFSQLVPWVINHGYLLFFIAALIEGPFVTAAGGVAAALGYYDVFIIMLLAIGGDIGGDLIFYSIGYKLRSLVKSDHLWFFGITKERVEKIERLLHRHTVKAVLFIKLTPLIGPPGLIILGSVRTPFKKLINTALGLAILKSIFFTLIGFYSAKAYVYLDKIIIKSQYTLGIIIAAVALIYFAYQKITSLLAKEIDKQA